MNALALLLVIAVTAASPADDGGPAASADAEQADASSPNAEAEVLAFLAPANRTASRDGEAATAADQSEETERYQRYLKLRNVYVKKAHALARALEAVRMQGNTSGAAAAELRTSLLNLTGAPLEEARAAFQEAIKWEERRLKLLERADTYADAAGSAVPEVDRVLVARRLAAIRGGAASETVEKWVGGYRDVALGLAAFLEGEQFRALEKMQKAADALPEFAPAHAFLGSLYFLFDKKDSALRAWRRAIELDPGNEQVRQALAAYGAKERLPAPGVKEKPQATGAKKKMQATGAKEKPQPTDANEKMRATGAKEKMQAATNGATDPENTL